MLAKLLRTSVAELSGSESARYFGFVLRAGVVAQSVSQAFGIIVLLRPSVIVSSTESLSFSYR
jgi:hypothetical protein